MDFPLGVRFSLKGVGFLQKRTLIIGGGVAGIAAAAALAKDHRVTLFEARDGLGGRAGSFAFAGGYLDACQHVSLGCCHALRALLRSAGLEASLVPQPRIWFHTLDGRVSSFGAAWLPWPLHHAGSFARAHWLSLSDKVAIARAVWWLKTHTPPQDDMPLAEWFRLTSQTQGAIEGLWGPIIVSALNEPWQTASFQAAAKVFVEGMLADRDSFRMDLPGCSLRELFDLSLGTWLSERGVTIRRNARVAQVVISRGSVQGVITREGEFVPAGTVIVALPPHQAQPLLPEGMIPKTGADRMGWAPITGVHLWLDRPLTTLPHAALIGTESHWLFRHRQAPRHPGDRAHYHQVVISASQASLEKGVDALRDRVIAELRRVFARAGPFEVLDSRVITERRATIRPVPGFQAHRPPARSGVPGLIWAGDWTDTGWPSTMEGAVRSGWMAARQARLGNATGEIRWPNQGGWTWD